MNENTELSLDKLFPNVNRKFEFVVCIEPPAQQENTLPPFNTSWAMKQQRPYFLIYWLVNRDPYNGLL